MRDYDRSSPLIVIHIPKTAGTSTKEIFKRWHADRLHEHDFNQRAGTPPKKLELAALHSVENPVAVYGHVNRPRGFGIEQYYRNALQFITMLRDPFERAISSYYFLRGVGPARANQSRIPRSDLREHLRSTQSNMFNHFPRPATKDNDRAMIDESFIEIGHAEHLTKSMRRIAGKLAMPFDLRWVPHLNPSTRDQSHPADPRDEYVERHALEYEVYECVLSRFAGERPD